MSRLTHPWLGTVLTVGAAIGVTAQALSTPPKPHKASDLVSVDDRSQAQLADACQMYPAECHFRADGSIARVVGRRIVPGTDRAVLEHFRTEIGALQDSSWDGPLRQASSNLKD